MRNDTRLKFNQYAGRIAEINNVDSVNYSFQIEPTIQQKLEEKIAESSDFLSKINTIGVDEMQGEKLKLGTNMPIASVTDTKVKDREPRDITTMEKDGYSCWKTNSDSYISYAKLDVWAKFKDFQTRLRNVLVKQQAVDRLMIAFNGEKRVNQSDIVANPLLQDVNIGWLQKYRTNAPQRIMLANDIGVIGEGDYKNLDALILDAKTNLLDPWHRQDTKLIAICGQDILFKNNFNIINQNYQPNEQKAASDMIFAPTRIGNISAVYVPFFPEGKILVTTFDNLSVYFQNGSRRRHIKDNPQRDRIENYESSNDDYVVEEYGRGFLLDGIKFKGDEVAQ